jgi:hypothetical protein
MPKERKAVQSEENNFINLFQVFSIPGEVWRKVGKLEFVLPEWNYS